ncbi:acyltransferase family protein [Rufibacter soli]
MTSEKAYFPALTGLRAVAAFLVFAHHALIPSIGKSPGGFLAQEGHLGVSIFFVLSGFLIGTRYSTSFSTLRGTEIRRFFLHRFARLYPMYLLCTVVALFFRQDFRPVSWLANLVMAQGFFSDLAFSGIGIGWSLTAEVCFYLAAPLLLFYWPRLRLAGSVVAIVLVGVVIAVAGNAFLTYGFLPDWHYFLRVTFFGRCLEFCLGIWLARHLGRTSANPTFAKPTLGFWTYGSALALLAGMVFLNVLPILFSPSSQNWLFHGTYHLLLPLVITGLLWGLCQENTLLSKALGSRLGQELGKGSYIFYLVHYTFGFDLLYFHVWPNRGGVMLLLAFFSVVGYYLLEAPLHKMILRAGSFSPSLKTKRPEVH